MFNLPNPFIASSFLGLMVSVSRCEGGPTVAWFERVENPDIKKCTLMPVIPKSLCTHIYSGTLRTGSSCFLCALPKLPLGRALSHHKQEAGCIYVNNVGFGMQLCTLAIMVPEGLA